jgi:hypothetical protein
MFYGLGSCWSILHELGSNGQHSRGAWHRDFARTANEGRGSNKIMAGVPETEPSKPSSRANMSGTRWDEPTKPLPRGREGCRMTLSNLLRRIEALDLATVDTLPAEMATARENRADPSGRLLGLSVGQARFPTRERRMGRTRTKRPF